MTKYIEVESNGQRYDIDGTSYFKGTDGTEYAVMRESSMELVGLLLEALGMDVCERDDLLERLEDKELDRQCNKRYGFNDDDGGWGDRADREYESYRENGAA